jgi:hypothetical protein
VLGEIDLFGFGDFEFEYDVFSFELRSVGLSSYVLLPYLTFCFFGLLLSLAVFANCFTNLF